ncbi:hypothetical protein F8388_005813 [Cannabis sativa]|uniref:Endonuclease/exonuclease/phosphatase domain-containing protein n=1 Tax=Cannabis sativa TaxID=3483 RepID=A0A7J6HHZ3_CANSA|nr:hypothetical protein F8388_005813 [Cannabis sativa]
MSLLCWNARGLGNPGALTALQTIVRKFSPSLVFLSETKLYGGWAEGIQRHVNFQNSFHVDCVGKSGGLLLLWNEDWEVSVKSFSVGHIDALVQCPGRRRVRETQKQLDDLLSVATPLYFGTIFSSASPSVKQVENGITSIEARGNTVQEDLELFLKLVSFQKGDREGGTSVVSACKNSEANSSSFFPSISFKLHSIFLCLRAQNLGFIFFSNE